MNGELMNGKQFFLHNSLKKTTALKFPQYICFDKNMYPRSCGVVLNFPQKLMKSACKCMAVDWAQPFIQV
jgi:hypothetical protein